MDHWTQTAANAPIFAIDARTASLRASPFPSASGLSDSHDDKSFSTRFRDAFQANLQKNLDNSVGYCLSFGQLAAYGSGS
jgi:hypothetical protein